MTTETAPIATTPLNRKFWLAAAAYILPTFPLGYIWHLSTFKASYDALQIYRPDVIIPIGLSSMIIQGIVFAWIYPRLFSTVRADWLASAAKFFALFGLLAWSFLVLPTAAKVHMTSVVDFLKLETGFTILQYLVAAPLIALAWRNSK